MAVKGGSPIAKAHTKSCAWGCSNMLCKATRPPAPSLPDYFALSLSLPPSPFFLSQYSTDSSSPSQPHQPHQVFIQKNTLYLAQRPDYALTERERERERKGGGGSNRLWGRERVNSRFRKGFAQKCCMVVNICRMFTMAYAMHKALAAVTDMQKHTHKNHGLNCPAC